MTEEKEMRTVMDLLGVDPGCDEVQTVSAWRTPDGKLFTTEREAVSHNIAIDFKNWYMTHALRQNQGSPAGLIVNVHPSQVLAWLNFNKRYLKILLDGEF